MAKGAEKDKILEDKNLCQRQALGELDWLISAAIEKVWVEKMTSFMETLLQNLGATEWTNASKATVMSSLLPLLQEDEISLELSSSTDWLLYLKKKVWWF